MPKMVTGPLSIASGLPMNTSFNSQDIPSTGIDTASFTIETTGVTVATGTFKVFAKNGSSGWVDLGISPGITLANANISSVILLADLAFSFIRLQYTRGTAGDTGTYSVWFQGEGMN